MLFSEREWDAVALAPFPNVQDLKVPFNHCRSLLGFFVGVQHIQNVPPTNGVEDNHLRESLDGSSSNAFVTPKHKIGHHEFKESTATEFCGNEHDA